MKYDMIIIGAGVSGLCAAYTVAANRPHMHILVLEKESVCGTAGQCHTAFYGARQGLLGISGEHDMLHHKTGIGNYWFYGLPEDWRTVYEVWL